MSTITSAAPAGVSRADRSAAPEGGLRFDRQFVLLSVLFVIGLFIDGWAHNHGQVDSSFFTPWHFVFYSAFGLVALFLAFTQYRNVKRGCTWNAALPRGYMLSLVGAVIFAVGGVGDLIWHTLFGIEAGSEALLSPSHITLAVGMVLIVTGPLRAAWLRREFPTNPRDKWNALLPALISATLLLSLMTFFTFYSNPITLPLASTWFAGAPSQEASTPIDQIYVANADGSGQIRLLGSNDWSASWAAWSPDGAHIAYSRGAQSAMWFNEYSPEPQTDLYIMNADGTGARQITNWPGEEYAPAWSPDGSQLAIIATVDGNPELYIINAEGTNQRRLTTTSALEWSPAWSPDGTRIAYQSDMDIWVMNADGTNAVQISDGSSSWQPSWSPDGQQIVYTRAGSNGFDIYIMSADGSNSTQLSESSVLEAQPVFTPDGESILFLSYRDGGTADIFRMPAGGELGEAVEAVNLTNNPATNEGRPMMSPDGTRILYVSQALMRNSGAALSMQDYGVTAIFLSVVFLCSVTLPLVRRWALPFGAITLVLLTHMVFMTVLSDTFFLIPAALVTGVVADLLAQRLKPWAERTAGFYTFAFVLPALYYGLYLATLALISGVGWNVHVWGGVIFISGVIGLLISFLITALQTPLAPLTGSEPARE